MREWDPTVELTFRTFCDLPVLSLVAVAAHVYQMLIQIMMNSDRELNKNLYYAKGITTFSFETTEAWRFFFAGEL